MAAGEAAERNASASGAGAGVGAGGAGATASAPWDYRQPVELHSAAAGASSWGKAWPSAAGSAGCW